MEQTKQVDQEKFIEFMTSGNATFTLKSLKTGTRFTYKVIAGTAAPIYFIKVLYGRDNTSDYKDMAILSSKDGEFPKLLPRAESKFNSETPSFKAFSFVFFNALVKIHMNNLEIWHEGRCCRCGRKLTVPESVESGIGPECATKVITHYF